MLILENDCLSRFLSRQAFILFALQFLVVVLWLPAFAVSTIQWVSISFKAMDLPKHLQLLH